MSCVILFRDTGTEDNGGRIFQNSTDSFLERNCDAIDRWNAAVTFNLLLVAAAAAAAENDTVASALQNGCKADIIVSA